MAQQTLNPGDAYEVVEVPDKRIGWIIGTGGARITEIKAQSGAQIHIDPPGSDMRKVTVWGVPAAVSVAVNLIRVSLTSTGRDQPGQKQEAQLTLEVKDSQVGAIIGRGGTNIKELRTRSMCEIWIEAVDEEHPNTGIRKVHIAGSAIHCETAKQMIGELMSGERQTSGALSRQVVDMSLRQVAALGNVTPAGGTDALHTVPPPPSQQPQQQQPSEPVLGADAIGDEATISDGALASLLDPSHPGYQPTALQQLQASGVRVHFSKERVVPPPSSRKRPHEDAVEVGAASSSSSSSSDAEGARTVLLAGSESAIASVKTLLASIEAHAAAAKAHFEARSLSTEEALMQYYQPFYAKAGLPYTPPVKLWQDEVELEANKYRAWASYYSAGGGQPPSKA